MAAGYIGLSFYNETIFFISLGLIILGNGFFKPNISTLVGRLYDNDEYKNRKDSGYNIFYMGINLGAFICNFVAAYLRINYGWGWAFAAAGVGMIIGLIWFRLGQQYATDIKKADVINTSSSSENVLKKLFIELLLPGFVAAFIGWNLSTWISGSALLGAQSTDAFVAFTLVIIYYFYTVYKEEYKINFIESRGFMSEEMAKINAKRKTEPVKALLTVFGVVVIFWAVFHQNGSALTVWAENYTNREIPASAEGVLSKFSLNQVVSTQKPDEYFANVPKSEWPQSGSTSLFSAELFQSVNPFFIITLTPIIVSFFMFLKRRKKELSTPTKIGFGLLISSLSSLVMVAAVIYTNNGSIKASPWWLISTYCVITIGEVFLSPMGLSIVSKLSPPRITALMMGGLMFSIAMGNKLSGVLSGLWNAYENKAWFFVLNTALLMVSVILIFLLLPWLKRVVSEHEKE